MTPPKAELLSRGRDPAAYPLEFLSGYPDVKGLWGRASGQNLRALFVVDGCRRPAHLEVGHLTRGRAAAELGRSLPAPADPFQFLLLEVLLHTEHDGGVVVGDLAAERPDHDAAVELALPLGDHEGCHTVAQQVDH